MKKVTLRYVERQTDLNSGAAGAISEIFWWANGLFDPRDAIGGHQPLGFDQMMLMYNHWVVIGAKITIDFVNLDATNPQIVGIRPADDAVALNSVERVMEFGTTKYKLLNKWGTAGDKTQMTYRINPNKFLGVSHPLSSSRVRGSATSNPAEGCFFGMFAAPQAAIDPGVVRCSVRIEYVALFMEPKELAQS